MTKSKKKVEKKPKLEISFDKSARSEFLSGFHKRKLQRKAFYKSKLEKRLAEEKKKIKAEAKKSVSKISSSHSILPEVESIIGMTQADLIDETKTKSESFTLGSKTVTISSLDDIHMKLPELEALSDDDEIVKDEPATPAGSSIKSILKKTTNRLLQQSKAFKASQRFKQKSKKSRAKNRLEKAGKGKGEEEGPVVKSRRGSSKYQKTSLRTKGKKRKGKNK